MIACFWVKNRTYGVDQSFGAADGSKSAWIFLLKRSKYVTVG